MGTRDNLPGEAGPIERKVTRDVPKDNLSVAVKLFHLQKGAFSLQIPLGISDIPVIPVLSGRIVGRRVPPAGARLKRRRLHYTLLTLLLSPIQPERPSTYTRGHIFRTRGDPRFEVEEDRQPATTQLHRTRRVLFRCYACPFCIRLSSTLDHQQGSQPCFPTPNDPSSRRSTCLRNSQYPVS